MMITLRASAHLRMYRHNIKDKKKQASPVRPKSYPVKTHFLIKKKLKKAGFVKLQDAYLFDPRNREVY